MLHSFFLGSTANAAPEGEIPVILLSTQAEFYHTASLTVYQSGITVVHRGSGEMIGQF